MPASAIPEVFVLWHPKCEIGEKLAQGLYSWLRPGRGFGPEVFFRSLPDPEKPERQLPMRLPGEPDEYGVVPPPPPPPFIGKSQVLFPLIDEHMVADAAWRRWLERLAQTRIPNGRVIFPVALDASAYNLAAELRALNYLRPAGLPLPAKYGDDALKIVQRSLNKQATEALCRLVLPRANVANETDSDRAQAPPPKISVFLSHAKKDGTGPARRLRDYIYSQTQLAAFFDENDIAYGGAFEQILKSAIGSGDTAALIAVRSVEYAKRPWCRREISLFRKPKLISRPGDAVERYSLFPSLVVEAMSGSELTVGVPEFGASTAIHWSDDEREIEEHIVTTVIRDALLSAYHAALGAAIPSAPGEIVINWLPDATTLLHIERVRTGTDVEILHPGFRLPGVELDILYELFPNVTFKSFAGTMM